jgi:hypothetical protein
MHGLTRHLSKGFRIGCAEGGGPGNRRRQRGIVIVKWTVIAALGFFAVLILERLALML